MNKEKIILIIIILLGTVSILSFFFIEWITIASQPELKEQATIIEKRTITEQDDIMMHTIIVSYEFSDGSVKELSMPEQYGPREFKKVYDTINEGDTGMLTYKERENIEEKIKKEENRWAGRQFISFEKDS